MFLLDGNNRRTNIESGGGYCVSNCPEIYTTWRKVANKITQKLMGGLNGIRDRTLVDLY